MKKLLPFLNKHLFKLLILSFISLSTACKKDKAPIPDDTTPKKYNVYFGENKNFYALNGKDGSLIWKYRTTGDFAYTTPATENGVIYVTNTDHNLHAIDAKTGILKWKFASSYNITTSPVVVNGVVYFGSDHYVYAIDATTGSLKWQYETGYDETRFYNGGYDYIESVPIVLNGVIYFGCLDGYLYVLDATSGSLKWKYDTGYSIRAAGPQISNNSVFVGNGKGILFAIDINTGLLKWTFDMNGITLDHTKIIAANGAIYFGSLTATAGYVPSSNYSAGSMYAIDEKDGSLIWKKLPFNGYSTGVGFANGKLYANDGGYLYAIDAQNGRTLWSQNIQTSSTPTVMYGKIFTGGNVLGFFYEIDAVSGNISWKFQAAKGIQISKALVVAEN